MLLKVATVVLVLGVLVSGKRDKTREWKARGRDVVDAAVGLVSTACIFPDDALFFRRIAKIGTDDGDDTTRTCTDNFKGGIWQVTEAEFKASQGSAMAAYHKKLNSAFKIKWGSLQWADLCKPFYSLLAAQLVIQVKGQTIPRSVSAQYNVWNSIFKREEVSVEEYTQKAALIKTKCKTPKADVIFVVDGSGSVGKSYFKKTLKFVETVVGSFNIGEKATHLGLVKYSTNAKVEFHLKQYYSRENIIKAVQSISYNGGNTNTAAALDYARDMMLGKYGRSTRREGVVRMIILLTDGKSTNPAATEIAAAKVHNSGITVFAVGIGSGVDSSELTILGSTPSCVHVYKLKNFDEIDFFADQIEAQSCKAPAKIEMGEKTEGFLEAGQTQFFEIEADVSTGITLEVEMEVGGAEIYVSNTTRNPGPAVNDYEATVTVDQGVAIEAYFPDDTSVGYRRRRSTAQKMPVYVAIYASDSNENNHFRLGGGAEQVKTSLMAMTLALILALYKY